MMKQAYKSYRMTENIKMIRVMCRFRGRVKIRVCILLFYCYVYICTVCHIFSSVKYLLLFCLTESELNKANK